LSDIFCFIKHFFNDSAAQFASFFTAETNLTEEELEELKKIVDQQIQKKKNAQSLGN
jgi:hypothetical protein